MLSKKDSPSCSASLARSVAVLVSVAGRSAAVLVSVADSSVVLPRALRVWDDILMVIPGRVFWFSLVAEVCADVEGDVEASGKSKSGVSLAVCADVEDGGVWASGKSGVVGAVAGVFGVDDRDFEDFFLPVGRAIMRSSKFS